MKGAQKALKVYIMGRLGQLTYLMLAPMADRIATAALWSWPNFT